jgi:hypothetical protein
MNVEKHCTKSRAVRDAAAQRRGLPRASEIARSPSHIPPLRHDELCSELLPSSRAQEQRVRDALAAVSDAVLGAEDGFWDADPHGYELDRLDHIVLSRRGTQSFLDPIAPDAGRIRLNVTNHSSVGQIAVVAPKQREHARISEIRPQGSTHVEPLGLETESMLWTRIDAPHADISPRTTLSGAIRYAFRLIVDYRQNVCPLGGIVSVERVVHRITELGGNIGFL